METVRQEIASTRGPAIRSSIEQSNLGGTAVRVNTAIRQACPESRCQRHCWPGCRNYPPNSSIASSVNRCRAWIPAPTLSSTYCPTYCLDDRGLEMEFIALLEGRPRIRSRATLWPRNPRRWSMTADRGWRRSSACCVSHGRCALQRRWRTTASSAARSGATAQSIRARLLPLLPSPKSLRGLLQSSRRRRKGPTVDAGTRRRS